MTVGSNDGLRATGMAYKEMMEQSVSQASVACTSTAAERGLGLILALEVIAADAQTSTETWETMHVRGEICD